MKPLTVWQGTDKTIVVSHNVSDLPQATEVAVYIDAPTQIIKTLGDGVIGVTASSYVLTIAAGDTADAIPGEYSLEARITNSSGGIDYGRISPSVVRIMETSFDG
jgi:hypothetical protein